MHSHYELILGALLHDVGKLGQRAHGPGQGLCPEARAMESLVCPTHKGHHTHLHALHSAEFILARMDYLPPGLDRERLNKLASWHHLPDDETTRLIQRADGLSAGMERERAGEAAEAGGFRRVRLRAITNEVALRRREAPGGNWVLPLRALDPGAAFPEPEDIPADRTAEYRVLWDGLIEDWNRNRLQHPWAYTNRALSVLERYTWCIASDTTGHPDVSLFDHLKTTAAIAACLARAAEGSEPFLLVTGDFGGIQDYLFSLHAGAGGLARGLRARSLFISLATESTVHGLLRRLDLPLTQCILSAGGGFTLLLPNTPPAHEAVEEVTRRLAAWSAAQTGFRLHPHLAALPVTEHQLRDDFGAVLASLRRRLAREKARPLGVALLGEDGWREEQFVQPPLLSEDEALCAVCDRAPGRPREEGGRPVCDACHQDARTGRSLVKARYIVFGEGEGRLPFGTAEPVDNESDIPPDAYLALDMDGGCGTLPHSPVFGRFIARHVPRTEDGVVEFTDLAARSAGRNALAYLKADVDNLGLIFDRGLRADGDDGNDEDDGADRRSISRLATLSRSLELFFGGYVQRLAQREDIYTVYSGGDDLLVVGPWDNVLRFACNLREGFGRFTCGNPDFGLSAGVAVVGAHTPLLMAAEEAERRLHDAKHSTGEGVRPWPDGPATGEARKDRLVALGTSLPWAELPALLTRAEQVRRWLRDEALSTGHVRRLLSCARLYQHWQRTGDLLAFRYAPMLVYDLKRNWTHAPPAAREWAAELTLRDSRQIPGLRFICEHALYGARGTEEGSDES